MNVLAAELSPLRAILEARIALIVSTWEKNAAGGMKPPDGLVASLDEHERVVFKLLVAPRPVSAAEVLSALGASCVAALLRVGVLRRAGENLESAGLRIRFIANLSLLAGDGGPGCYVHLGYDTLLLTGAARRLRPAARALELCCGGAGPAITLAETHRSVTAVDLFEGVANVARANIALAGLDRIEVRAGDLWEPVAGERFDTIIANPPFFPSIDGRENDPAAVAGQDGLDFSRMIWASADAFLAPDGVLLVLTGLFGKGERLLAEQELAELARDKGWKVEVIASEPPRRIERIAVTLLQDEPVNDRSRNLYERAQQLEATHYHVVLLRMSVDPDPGVVMLRTYPETGENLKTRMNDLRRQRLSKR
jgi:tRNA1(Val) A37 N6-methylase TrmN6